MSLLSENLQYWRAERPSEWKMDEFINGAKRMEQKIKKLESLHDILLKCVDDITRECAPDEMYSIACMTLDEYEGLK